MVNREVEIGIHILFWLLLSFLFYSLLELIVTPSTAIKSTIANIGCLSLIAYTNAYFIVPKCFEKGKLHWFFLAVITLFILALGFRNIMVDSLQLTEAFIKEMGQVSGRTPGLVARNLPIILLSLVSFMASSIFAFYKKITTRDNESLRLKKEKIQHELNFLRSQINPHFLFNALNNLNAIVQLKPEKASSSILRLSSMLRYVLEKCKKDQVLLSEEIQYIKDYIAYQKQKDDDLENISFEIGEIDHSQYLIEPMLLIPFVENAYQHSQTENTQDQTIKISLSIIDRRLQFTTVNNIGEAVDLTNANTIGITGGVGLSNVKRRLELLYPRTHGLISNQNDGFFFSKLTIEQLTMQHDYQ